MSRLTSVKKKSLLKTSDNSECNKENVNIEAKSLGEQDSPRMGELQQAFEKLQIDEERPLRKRRTSVKLNAAEVTKKNHKEKKMNKTHDAKEMKKSVKEKKCDASSKANSTSKKRENSMNQGENPSISAEIEHEKPQKSSTKKKEQKSGDAQSTSAESSSGIKDGGNSSRKMSVNKVKPNNEFPTKIGTLSELLLTTNNKTLPAPIKPRPKARTSHKNSPIPTASKINKDDRKAIKTEMKSTRKQISKKTTKLESTNDKTAPWKIDKTELPSPSSNNDNIKISQSTIPIKPRGNKQSAVKPGEIAIPKVESPAVALFKREKPSPQSPIASVSIKLGNWGTPPSTSSSILSAIDMNKYKPSPVDERKAVNDKPIIKQEKVVDKNLGATSLKKNKLKKDDGCSSVDPKLHQRSSKGEPKAKPQVNPVGKPKQEGSRKKAHRRQRKEEKVAVAFEKLAKRFVSTAKKMGYLDESKGDPSTDNSEDSEGSGDCINSSHSSDSDSDSEHSTECSCSSCTGTSSDYSTEFTLSTSSSTGYSDSSSSSSSSSSLSSSSSDTD